MKRSLTNLAVLAFVGLGVGSLGHPANATPMEHRKLDQTHIIAIATPATAPSSNNSHPLPAPSSSLPTAVSSLPSVSSLPPGSTQSFPIVIVPAYPPIASTPTPNPIATTRLPDSVTPQGSTYRVVVYASSARRQARVRASVSDAFRTTINGRSAMQVGLFRDRTSAEALQARLSGDRLRARIIPLIPENTATSTLPPLPL